MITKKFDKDVEAIRDTFPNADSFTVSYGSGHACATIQHGGHTTLILITAGRYNLTAGGASDGYTCAVFATLADLLTWLDGGKAA